MIVKAKNWMGPNNFPVWNELKKGKQWGDFQNKSQQSKQRQDLDSTSVQKMHA